MCTRARSVPNHEERTIVLIHCRETRPGVGCATQRAEGPANAWLSRGGGHNPSHKSPLRAAPLHNISMAMQNQCFMVHGSSEHRMRAVSGQIASEVRAPPRAQRSVLCGERDGWEGALFRAGSSERVLASLWISGTVLGGCEQQNEHCTLCWIVDRGKGSTR